jgi:hypothetical protein
LNSPPPPSSSSSGMLSCGVLGGGFSRLAGEVLPVLEASPSAKESLSLLPKTKMSDSLASPVRLRNSLIELQLSINITSTSDIGLPVQRPPKLHAGTLLPIRHGVPTPLDSYKAPYPPQPSSRDLFPSIVPVNSQTAPFLTALLASPSFERPTCQLRCHLQASFNHLFVSA